MFETMKKNSKTTFTLKTLRIINVSLIIFLLVNDVHNMEMSFPASPGEFKYVVSIQLSNLHWCTGTIISQSHILTIGHVLLGQYYSQVSVVTGGTLLMHPFAHSSLIDQIHIHPDIKQMSALGEHYWENDIAIIKLKEKFQWSIFYGPAPLMTEQPHLLLCSYCQMISWTKSRQERYELLTLMWDLVNEKFDSFCNERNIPVLKNEKCFSDIFNSLSINSDHLGSPIVCDNLMIGLVTKITEAEVAGTPSTFLNILPYSTFINEVLRDGLVDFGPTAFTPVVTIWYDNEYICAGSILDRIHILIVAHCVWSLEMDKLKVVAGLTEISQEHITTGGLSVHDIIYHEQYELHIFENKKHWFAEHDIAVIKLENPLPFHLTFHELDYRNAVNPMTPGLLHHSLHWRHEKNTAGMETIKLKIAQMVTLTNELCETILESQEMPISDNQFCGRNPYHIKIANYEDCGNLILIGGKPLGLLVKTFPLSPQSPSTVVFLLLHPYIEFLNSVLGRS